MPTNPIPSSKRRRTSFIRHAVDLDVYEDDEEVNCNPYTTCSDDAPIDYGSENDSEYVEDATNDNDLLSEFEADDLCQISTLRMIPLISPMKRIWTMIFQHRSTAKNSPNLA